MTKKRDSPKKVKSDWVRSFKSVAVALDISVADVGRLVKSGDLVQVESAVFCVRAITKKSLSKYQQKLGMEREERMREDEWMSTDEACAFLGIKESLFRSLVNRGVITKTGYRKYSKISIEKYKKNGVTK